MKKRIAAILLTAVILCAALPLASNAASVKAELVKTSGAVYPGSSLNVAIVADGTNIEMMQGRIIEYDANQLSMNGKPSSGIEGWSYSEGGVNFIIDKALSASAVSGNGLTLLKYSFKLKEGVKIGDTISIKIKNVIISTTSADGFTGDLSYSVKVAEKPKNTNTNLMALRCEEGTLTPAFAPSTVDYSLKVAHTVTALTLTPVPAGEGATYTVSGNENLSYGENTVRITVKAENGDVKTYTLTVLRADPPSAVSKLSLIEVAGYTLSPAFDPSVLEYQLSVPAETKTLKISAQPEDAHAKINVRGNSDFKEGVNIVKIIVDAENGVDQTEYVLRVNRARSIEEDATLASLSFGDFPLSPAFDKTSQKQEYTVNVPNDVTECSLLRAAMSGKYAKIAIDAPEKLSVGENAVIVSVTNEAGNKVTNYFLTVVRGKNEDATLKSLTVSKGVLEPAFSPEILSYALITDADPGQISITAEPNNENSYAEQLSFIPSEGVTRQTILCTAQSGKELEYTVFVFTKPAYLIIEGTPAVGQTLRTRMSGYSDNGSYSWYANGEKIEGQTASTYKIAEKDDGKIIYAVYEIGGASVKSQLMTISGEVSVSEKGEISIIPDVPNRTTDLIIVIVVAVVCIILGLIIGAFFAKRKNKKQK